MKKVAFFLDNSAIASKDCSNALDANPGIGGTEWLFIVVPTLLSDRKNDIDVCLYTTMPGHFPSELQTTVVKDVSDAILLAIVLFPAPEGPSIATFIIYSPPFQTNTYILYYKISKYTIDF